MSALRKSIGVVERFARSKLQPTFVKAMAQQQAKPARLDIEAHFMNISNQTESFVKHTNSSNQEWKTAYKKRRAEVHFDEQGFEVLADIVEDANSKLFTNHFEKRCNDVTSFARDINNCNRLWRVTRGSRMLADHFESRSNGVKVFVAGINESNNLWRQAKLARGEPLYG